MKRSTFLDPQTWGRTRLTELTSAAVIGPKEMARGKRHAVSTHHPLSAYAGLQALRSGGTAADALVAMVAADVVLVPGTSTLAGSMNAVYHEAVTGTTYSLNAGLNSVLDDRDPYDHLQHRETGRAVLVPGMIAGLEALWQRFGRLDWSDLWLPAIYFAREGFPLYPLYWGNMQRRQAVLLRFSEGRAIFAPEGDLPALGSLFRQPHLSQTLEHLAREGAAYAYRGEWASALVVAVQGLGGQMGLEDLARYEVRWEQPTVGTYLDYDIQTCTAPHYGGPALLLALNIAEALNLHERPQRWDSAQSLYDEIQAGKCAMSTAGFQIDPKTASEETCVEFSRLLSKDFALEEAQRIRAGRKSQPDHPLVCGSHHVAAVDEAGNMVTATHTIEADSWGDTGLFIGGISLNSTAFQLMEARPRPGDRITEPLSNYIVFKDGIPLFAAGGIGSGLLATNLQNTVNRLGHGLDWNVSIGRPRWGYFAFDIAAWRLGEEMQCEEFTPTLLAEVEALGQPLDRQDRHELGHAKADVGFWNAVGYDPETQNTLAVTDPRLMGLALAD
jgi:gamma-glutamyltranspeptidase/glutathione hydrolase